MIGGMTIDGAQRKPLNLDALDKDDLAEAFAKWKRRAFDSQTIERDLFINKNTPQ